MGARHSLRLLNSEGKIFQAKLARRRGEIAKLWLRTKLFEKLNPKNRRYDVFAVIARETRAVAPHARSALAGESWRGG